MPGEIPDLEEVAALSTFAQAQAFAAQTAQHVERYVADTNLSFARFAGGTWAGDSMRGAPIGLLISTTAFRCRWLLINALTQGRLYLCEGGDKTRPVDNVDLWDRLQKPMGSAAPAVGLKAWFSMLGSQLIEQGDAHVWVTEEESITRRSRDGKKAIARAFIPLPATSVEPYQTKGFYALDYWQVTDRVSGRFYRLTPDEVVFLTYLDNTRDFFRGVGPMESCANSLDTDVLAAGATNNSLMKGGLPQLLLMAKRPHIRQEELDAYLAEFRRQLFSARGSKAGVSMLSEAFDLEKLSQTFQEMGIVDLRRYAVEEITRAHGIQPCLVGQIDGNALSREILSVAHEEMFVDTVIPLGDRMCEQLGPLIHLYEPELDLCIAWDHVPALRGKLGEKLDNARKFWDMGLSLEEASRACEIPEFDADPAAIKTRWIGNGVKPMAQILGETAWQQRVAEERGVDGEDAVPPPTERLVDVAQSTQILQVVQAYRTGAADRESAKGVLVGLFGLSDDRAELVLGTEPPAVDLKGPAPPPVPSDPGHVTVPPDSEVTPDPVSTQGNDPGADPTVPGASPGMPAKLAEKKGGSPEPSKGKAAFHVTLDGETRRPFSGDILTTSAALETLVRARLIEPHERDVLAHALAMVPAEAEARGIRLAALHPEVRDERERDIAKRIVARSRACEQAVAAVWTRTVRKQIASVDDALWRAMRRREKSGRADTAIELRRDAAGAYSTDLPAPTMLVEVAEKVDVEAIAAAVVPSIMRAYNAGLLDGVRELADSGEPLADEPEAVAARAEGRRLEAEQGVKGWALQIATELRADVLGLLAAMVAEGKATKDIRRALRELRVEACAFERFVADERSDARKQTRKIKNTKSGAARDEAFRRYNDARRQIVEDAAESRGRVAVFRWNTQRDLRVRDTHKAIDRAAVPHGESFVEYAKLRWPHDEEAPADETINCRCFTTRVGSIPAGEAAPDD